MLANELLSVNRIHPILEDMETPSESSLFAFCSKSFYDEYNGCNTVESQEAEVTG